MKLPGLSKETQALLGWCGAGECGLMTKSQVMLMLLAQGPHFESHCFI